MITINEHDGSITDFKWSHQDAGISGGGIGFIISISKDQTVKVFSILKTSAECLVTFKHDSQITSLGLSPDNQVLAVGGQNSDIYVWSLKDQKLIRSFGTNNLGKSDDVEMKDCN